MVINYLCSFFSSLSARSLWDEDFKLVVWSLASAIALSTDEFGFLIVRVPGSSGHGSLTGYGAGTNTVLGLWKWWICLVFPG